jgi:predicted patatin/cPLA2 family phospholipase
MDRDVIVIMEGGTIQGVFSAGVASILQKVNLYPRIHSIYAVSSGAHNAAYFLSRKVDVGASIYHDYLLKRHSFLKHLSFKVIVKKILLLFFLGRSFDVIDLAYIEDLERDILPLDLTRIKTSPIKFLVRVFNPKTRKIEYLDARTNTIEKLIQSAKVPPYAYSRAHKDKYFDGGIMPTKSFLNDVVKKNPDKKIIYIFCDKKTFRRVTRFIMADLLDILFKTRYLGLRYGLKHLFNIYNYTYVSNLKKFKNVITVFDSTGNSKREKKKEKIMSAFNDGVIKGKHILKELKKIDQKQKES